MRIRYSWYTLVTVLALPLILMLSAHVSANSKIQVYVDREPVVFTLDPVIDRGTTLVQLRPLLEALGVDISWSAAQRTVTGVKDDNRFSLTLDQSHAQVNGQRLALSVPGRSVNGHTMIPLRFVGESTGAAVGWNGNTRTISVYSQELIELIGLSQEDAQREVTEGAWNRTSATTTSPSGLYSRSYTHYSDNRNCVGVCMDQLYFVNDRQVATSLPPEGPDAVRCTAGQCQSYEIKGGQLILGSGQSFKIEQLSADHFTLDGRTYVRHEPLSRLQLDGAYVTNIAGNLSNNQTYVFQADGTFTEQGESASAGTYTVINYGILLKHDGGRVEKRMFYRPDHNERVLQIGGSMYTRDTSGPSIKTAPLPDKLTTERQAEKKLFSTAAPSRQRELKDVFVTLQAYQWAELDIHPDYSHTFQGFGNEGVIALTVRYEVQNRTGQTLDTATLEPRLRVNNFAGEVLASPNLVPPPVGALKTDEAATQLAVFLFPKDRYSEFTRFELALGGLTLNGGAPWFGEQWLVFDIFNTLD
ncbi:copper amine oxidase N-terminal domain-containing protein [Paenibacillus daejeonensis]|uniref:copper amine oxidase N-terminal domain-containing protein n=1 Tax=Paenibacillus daejeonensis TaxID=135193 RepID=UPI00037AA116|nr:copper amine oxidase N-terminal domain-containing protein [Paenibacillus daejeonensis]